MTANDYISIMRSYLGTTWDVDGYAGFQCVDFFKIGCKELGIPVYATGTGWASGYWLNRHSNETSKKYFDFINKDNIKPGDWLFFQNPEHVALYLGDGYILGGNQHGKNDPVDIVKMTGYKTLLGGFRYKKFSDKIVNPHNCPFLVRVSISNLYIRINPTIHSNNRGFIPKGAYTITETKESDGYLWGRLKSGAGWIALDYTEFLWEV